MEGIPAKQQKFIFNGNEMMNYESVTKLQDKDQIFLLLDESVCIYTFKTQI